MDWQVPVVLGTAALHYLVVTRDRGFFTGDGIFVISQLLLVLGTISIANAADPVEAKYINVVMIPFVVYCLTSIVMHLARPISASAIKVLAGPLRAPEVLLAIASAGIVVAYFAILGYSAFIVGVQGLFSGQSEDIATLRVESYSGTRYLAPGYVNQFKNVILPALAVVGAVVLFRQKSPFALPWTLLMGGGALLGLLGTGQRGAFVLIALVVIVTLRYASTGLGFVRRVIPLALVLLTITLGSTLVLGRSSNEVQGEEGIGAQIGILLSELWGRVAEDNQLSGLAAFRYTERIAPAWGVDWAEGILGLSPFHRGSTLANDVFASLYGSDRGTSPPSIWGSVYYNFGAVGLLALPILLVAFNRFLARCFFSRRDRDILEVVGYAGMFVVLGMWVAGSPDYLFNTGIVAYVVLIWLGRKRRERGGEHEVGMPLPFLPRRRGSRSER